MRETITGTIFKLYEIALPFFEIALVVAVFFLIPMSLWKKTRTTASNGLLVASYVFGVTTWLLGAGVSFASYGWIGLTIGLLLLGVGVVPLAICGALFKLDSGGLAAVLLVMVITTFATRIGGAYLKSNHNYEK